jgi:hypothetical protein
VLDDLVKNVARKNLHSATGNDILVWTQFFPESSMGAMAFGLLCYCLLSRSRFFTGALPDSYPDGSR